MSFERRELVAHDAAVRRLEGVESMHSRKARMCALADAFCVLPGGLGTLDETFEIITWKQLGLHDKPVVLVNLDGYWTPLLEADLMPPQDPKTALQEWAQGRGLPLPAYRELRRDGPPHEPLFTGVVSVAGQEPAQGEGRSKRLAERAAADRLLAQLEGGGA